MNNSLPQTPAGGVGGKGSGSAGAGSGMVNGSGADHQDIRDGAAINTEHVIEVAELITHCSDQGVVCRLGGSCGGSRPQLDQQD
ncbi:hypothetical protein K0M31_007853 [Melipona bicolor]|uniref:Uncharacterized protein n=1 Tax=Melipona bicolor TaxID=60889 RepID=A0AA40GC58_9HYME|nr:hypothetical protein K0M31_007853 [Melipona bicolor]